MPEFHSMSTIHGDVWDWTMSEWLSIHSLGGFELRVNRWVWIAIHGEFSESGDPNRKWSPACDSDGYLHETTKVIQQKICGFKKWKLHLRLEKQKTLWILDVCSTILRTGKYRKRYCKNRWILSVSTDLYVPWVRVHLSFSSKIRLIYVLSTDVHWVKVQL